jgi:chloride channel 7
MHKTSSAPRLGVSAGNSSDSLSEFSLAQSPPERVFSNVKVGIEPTIDLNSSGILTYGRQKSLRIEKINKLPFAARYESLDFETLKTKIFMTRKKTRGTVFMEWTAYALIGILTALVSAIMVSIEEFMVHEKRALTDHLIGGDSNNLVGGWLFFSGISVLLAFLASCLTIFYGPGATGSGITELIAYLNGVNYPKLLCFESFFTKIFGVILAVLGNLCVGKEGPMAHIGANVAAAVAYLPLPRYEYLRNDWNKRQLIAAGVSAGVSTAFGAPIGGALFAYEMSKPNTFWSFNMLWKAFFSCSIAVFLQSVIIKLMQTGHANDISQVHELKFTATEVTSPGMESLVAAVILGVITGLLGSFFIYVNTNLSMKRKQMVTHNWQKLLEVAVFSLATSTAFYWTPALVGTCESNVLISAEN